MTVSQEYQFTAKGEDIADVVRELDDVIRDAKIRQIRESAEGLGEEEIREVLEDRKE